VRKGRREKRRENACERERESEGGEERDWARVGVTELVSERETQEYVSEEPQEQM